MKIVAFIQMYNEENRGNLRRCLDNCKIWADDIVIYDDASTDNSVKIAKEYTEHIILGGKNDFFSELNHKQTLLNKALGLNPTHILWIDCDETLDAMGTRDNVIRLCEQMDAAKIDGVFFKEVNLWRSERWKRVDSLFDEGWFCRLWRVTPDITFDIKHGLHQRLFPISINRTFRYNDISMLHYGFSNYDNLLDKIRDREIKDHPELAKDDWKNALLLDLVANNKIVDARVLNEEPLVLVDIDNSIFPAGNVPTIEYTKPVGFKYNTAEDISLYAHNYNWI